MRRWPYVSRCCPATFDAQRGAGRVGGGHRPRPGGRRHRGGVRLRVPAVPRRPAPPRRRPRRGARGRGARAPRRAARSPLRALRAAAGAGRERRPVLHLMVLRAALLWLSEQRGIFSFIRGNRLARRFAARFVAGETVEAAVAALAELNAAGIPASLDLLGESVTSAAEAGAARDTYRETLDRIRQTGADSNVSVKLTQMGLDLDERLCVENMRAIIAKARSYGSFVRIDMEQSAYTDTTLRLFRRTFHPEFGSTVGVVLQSYLRRTQQDLEE